MGSLSFLDRQLPFLIPPTCTVVTRFAPSPNGQLHLGHAFSALCAHDFARAFAGQFRLRIEDIDGQRSRPDHVQGIMTDMEWLGLAHDGAVQFQSQHIPRYEAARDHLISTGLLYRCGCTRGDITKALKMHPVPHGPDGPQYPGTCRERPFEGNGPFSWRLDMAKALAEVGPLTWTDLAHGQQYADPGTFGDVVIWRKDAPASYHLAATVDDAADGITHVVRGKDLFAYTAIHRLLQQLLGLREAIYWHHPLVLDAQGEKLAKSKSAPALAVRRLSGVSGSELIDNLREGTLTLGISLSDT